MGWNDQGDPNMSTLAGDTPGSLGVNDYASAPVCYGDPTYDEEEGICNLAVPPSSADDWEPLVSGAVPIGTGAAAVVRIPVPGSGGLYIEFFPRNYKGKSTSTLFIQDLKGKKHLRLDYGHNPVTNKVDYHWNHKSSYAQFGIIDHTTVGRGGKALYEGARYFRYAGRVLLVAGVVGDIYSIVVAKKKLRQVAKVVGGWAGAAGGCTAVGAGGAKIGSIKPGLGTAVGGIAGCIIGGVAGYAGASWAAGEAYDWVEETFFEAVPEVEAP
jgi:hypothetical protein